MKTGDFIVLKRNVVKNSYPKENKSIMNSLKDLSLWSLLISNILIGYFLIKQGFSPANLLWVYLAQSIIIGIFGFSKMFIFEKESRNNIWIILKDKIFPYALPHMIYAAFILAFLHLGMRLSINGIYIISGIGIFFINHFFSFIYNLNSDKKRFEQKKREIKSESDKNLNTFNMSSRIIPIHLTILLGIFVFAFTKITNYFWLSIVFLTLKTYLDLQEHVKEHAR